MKCVTMDSVKPKVLAPGMYAIGVEPIPPRNRNNREVHLGVINSIEASGSKPKRNTKNTRILPARSDNEEEMCYEIFDFCECTPLVKDALSTVKQVWKETGKLFVNVGYQWKPTGRKFTLGEQYPLTRFTKSKVVSVKQPEHVSSSNIVISERLSNNSQQPLARYKHKTKQEKAISNGIPTTAETQSIDASVVQIVLWYLDSGCSKHMTGNRSRLMNFMKKFTGTVRFGNDHFGAIMGYGDYVIGDSVISRVYYMEGLGHNLFFVGQFCDSNLEVAFRKYSCYVRNEDGVDLLKGSHSSNMYTISVEDMMKSSPICLLSKASNNKSWLWHRRLNHLNFGIINDLARKDLNNVVKRRNQTLMEAARTMLIFSKAPMFLWAEAVATACYTQNRSLIDTRHIKTPYELMHDKKPDLKFL
ncbi:integrase, catalytic region, zinc finger, CCHC-type containing protein [Tanacetum coccineum]